MRKIKNKDLYSVVNKSTGKIHAIATTKEKALAQIRLIENIDKNKKNKFK